MGNRARHPDKDIEAAIKHAESKGWTVKKRDGKGHAWGILLCPYNDNSCRGGIFCRVSIWSTPKNPQNHARDLKKHVDGCIKSKQHENMEKGQEDV